MSPEDFIRKHITAALMAEGFSESAAGGLSTASIITGEAHRRAGKGRFSMIASTELVSGLSADNHRRTESSKEKAGASWWSSSRPVLTSAMHIKSTWRGKFMKNLSRQSDYKSSAGELNVSRNGRH
jgi:hypothetical protein